MKRIIGPRILCGIVFGCILLGNPLALAQEVPAHAWNAQPYVGRDARPVDLVLVLDTSGSMKKLLDAVRYRMWEVANEFAGMRPTPLLRVGLVTYGNRAGMEANGWIVKHTDLTYDLDFVYSKLMELEPTGHEELVGRALSTAVDTMNWSEDRSAVKIIFVAGNESADQQIDHHDFRNAAADARDLDIIINAIYAGSHDQGIEMLWNELAELGAGEFLAVADTTATRKSHAPQDAELKKLSAMFNATHIPFGARGNDGLANQIAQDANAEKIGAFESRIATKASSLYTSSSWDLVDASQHPDFDWDALTEEDLPEGLRRMNREDLVLLVEEKGAKREAIRHQLQQIGAQREQHLRSELGAAYRASDDVGSAMRESIRKLAEEKGFVREK